jgi:hypothetical protein
MNLGFFSKWNVDFCQAEWFTAPLFNGLHHPPCRIRTTEKSTVGSLPDTNTVSFPYLCLLAGCIHNLPAYTIGTIHKAMTLLSVKLVSPIA